MSRSELRSGSLTARYGGAVGCAVAALLVRAAMGSKLAAHYPNAVSFVAVVFAARFLGLGPALVVIAAALADNFLFGHRPDAGRELIFLVGSCAVVWMIELLHRAKADAEEQARLA